jgi:hypothetical protein
MRVWLTILGIAFALPAQSAEPQMGISPEELKAHLTAWGYEVFAHEDEEDRPQLLVSHPSDDAHTEEVGDHKGFAMLMLDCKPEEAMFMQRRCDGFEFRAYLTPGFPIKDKVYAEWNRDLGHSRAFVKEGHPRLAWRVHVRGGFVWENILDTVGVWRAEQAAFVDRLDAAVMD